LVFKYLSSAAVAALVGSAALAHPASEAHGPLPALHMHLFGVQIDPALGILGVIGVGAVLWSVIRRRG